MDHLELIKTGRVLLSGTLEKEYTWETISPIHIVVYIYSGELVLTYGIHTLTFVAGDTVLVPKNQLTRSLKRPVDGEAFKCVSLFLPEKELREFYQDRPVSESWSENISKAF